jgi:SRSO17 transposase
MLLLDESADEKAGLKSVGAARQYNGRMGKVDLSQVRVFLVYSTIPPTLESPVWTWVDGEVFLPEFWFDAAMAPECKRLGIPAERRFATKVELGCPLRRSAATICTDAAPGSGARQRRPKLSTWRTCR